MWEEQEEGKNQMAYGRVFRARKGWNRQLGHWDGRSCNTFFWRLTEEGGRVKEREGRHEHPERGRDREHTWMPHASGTQQRWRLQETGVAERQEWLQLVHCSSSSGARLQPLWVALHTCHLLSFSKLSSKADLLLTIGSWGDPGVQRG